MPGLRIEIDTDAADRASRNLRKELTSLGAEAATNEAEFKKLESRLHDGMSADKASKNVDGLRSSLKLTRLETARLQAKLGDTGAAFKTLSGGISPTKAALVAATAAMVALGAATVKATKTGMEFEQTMKTVEAVSRATDSEIIALTASAREMGATTEWSATQAAESLKFMSMAGMAATDSIAALPGMLDLATAAQTDLATASDIATDTLTAFGMSTSEITRLSDALVNTSTRANTTVTMLGESFKYVAPVASNMGYSIEEASGFLGILANSGIKAESAGTSLRQTLLRTGKAAKSLGMDIDSSLIDVLEEMHKRQYSVNDVTEQFGIIASTGVTILMNNVDAYKELTKEIEGGEGATKELATTMRDTLSNDFKILGSTIDDALLSMYEIFGPNVRNLIHDITDAITDNKDSFDSLGQFISRVSFLFSGFVTVASDATKATKVLWDIFSSIPDGFTDFFSDLADEINRAKDETNGLNVAIGEIKAPKQTTFDAALNSLETWGKNIIELFDFAGESIGAVLALLAKDGADIVRMLAEEFLSLGKVVISALNPWGDVQETFQKEFGSIFSASATFLKNIETNYDVYSNNINGRWEEMLDKMVKNTAVSATEIGKELETLSSGSTNESGGGEPKNLYADYEQQIRDSLNNTLAYQIKIKQEALDLYKAGGETQVDIVAFAEAEILKLKQQYAEQHKQILIDYSSDIESFYSAYDKATLSSFEIQEKALEASYVERLSLVEKGLISELDLDTQFIAAWQKLQDVVLQKIADQKAKEIAAEESAAKEIQDIREGMLNDLSGDSYYEKQIKEIKEYADAYIDISEDIVTAEEWKNLKIQELDEETYRFKREQDEASLSDITSSLTSIAGLYEEGSKAQQAASAAAQITYAAEMALLVQKNLMIAVGAVANQGTGDPYTAFARMAAMAASVAGILSIANIDFSSGSSGSSSGTEQNIGLVDSTGTVLGDESALSESLSNSFEFLEDIGADQYATLIDIFYEMQDLNSNITNLASSIVRDYGDFSADSFGIDEGTVTSSFETGAVEALNMPFPEIDYLSNWVGEVIGGLLGDIFGGEVTTKMTGAGLHIAPWSSTEGSPDYYDTNIGGKTPDFSEYENAIKTAGANVDVYQETKIEEDGGWFGSDKKRYKTALADANEDTTTYFTKVLESYVSLAKTFTSELGVSSEEQVASYTFDLGYINLQDLSGDEITEAIENVFSEVGDNMVEDLFGDSIKQYQEINEGLFETAIRIIGVKNVVSESFDKIGVSFDVTSAEAISFSQTIVDLSGDIEEFQKNFESFYDAFYSTAEKQANFKDLAISSLEYTDQEIKFPETEEAFRSLVTSLDVTTESGMKLYTTLMSLSDGAVEYYEYLEDIESFNSSVQSIIDDYTLSDYEISLKALNDWFETQEDTANDLGISIERLNYAYALQKIELDSDLYNDEIEAVLEAYTENLEDFADNVKAFATELSSLTVEFLGLVGEDRMITNLSRDARISEIQETYGDGAGAIQRVQTAIWILEDTSKTAADTLTALNTAESNLSTAKSNYLSKLESELSLLEDNLNDAKDVYLDLLESELELLEDDLTDAKSNYIALMEDEISAYESSSSSLETVIDDLAEFRSNLYIEEGAGSVDSRGTALSTVNSLVLDAMGGGIESFSNISGALSDFVTASKEESGSYLDFARDVAMAARISYDVETEAGLQDVDNTTEMDLLQSIIDAVNGIGELDIFSTIVSSVLGVSSDVQTMDQAQAIYDRIQALQGTDNYTALMGVIGAIGETTESVLSIPSDIDSAQTMIDAISGIAGASIFSDIVGSVVGVSGDIQTMDQARSIYEQVQESQNTDNYEALIGIISAVGWNTESILAIPTDIDSAQAMINAISGIADSNVFSEIVESVIGVSGDIKNMDQALAIYDQIQYLQGTQDYTALMGIIGAVDGVTDSVIAMPTDIDSAQSMIDAILGIAEFNVFDDIVTSVLGVSSDIQTMDQAMAVYDQIQALQGTDNYTALMGVVNAVDGVTESVLTMPTGIEDAQAIVDAVVGVSGDVTDMDSARSIYEAAKSALDEADYQAQINLLTGANDLTTNLSDAEAAYDVAKTALEQSWYESEIDALYGIEMGVIALKAIYESAASEQASALQAQTVAAQASAAAVANYSAQVATLMTDLQAADAAAADAQRVASTVLPSVSTFWAANPGVQQSYLAGEQNISWYNPDKTEQDFIEWYAATNNSSFGTSAFEASYLAKNPDVANYGESASLHWLKYGQYEGRQYADGGIASGPTSGYPATLHGTEAVIPLKSGSIPIEIMDGGYNNEIIIELQKVRTELVQLRKENSNYSVAIAVNTKKTASTMESWDELGAPAERVVA